jgi:hypothetical protein
MHAHLQSELTSEEKESRVSPLRPRRRGRRSFPQAGIDTRPATRARSSRPKATHQSRHVSGEVARATASTVHSTPDHVEASCDKPRRAVGADVETDRPVRRVGARERPQMVRSAMTTDRPMATSARSLKQRAAAGGPIINVKINSAPTTGNGHRRGARQDDEEDHLESLGANPLAAAISGAIEVKSSGRYSTATAHTHGSRARSPATAVPCSRRESRRTTGKRSRARTRCSD